MPSVFVAATQPTNHLDLDAIRWLETFLKGYSATLVFISHDRAFIRSLATRIIELDRGKLTSWPGDYDKYLAGKQAALENEERANAEFDKKLSQEERCAGDECNGPPHAP